MDMRTMIQLHSKTFWLRLQLLRYMDTDPSSRQDLSEIADLLGLANAALWRLVSGQPVAAEWSQ
jgi:hypothetical protein